MKKSSLILGTCLLLSACGGYEVDLDKTAEIRNENRRIYHQEYGCSLMRENESYRQCILNTYQKNTPHTFITDNTDDGKSLAIIRNETNSSYDAEKGTYKTERVIVIETEERLVPVEQAYIQPQETLVEDFIPEEIEEPILEAPIPPPPVLTEVMPTPSSEKEMIEVDTTTEVITETQVTDTLPTEEVKATWWETYQQEKEPETVPELKCPCEDPNDPCLHCVEK